MGLSDKGSGSAVVSTLCPKASSSAFRDRPGIYRIKKWSGSERGMLLRGSHCPGHAAPARGRGELCGERGTGTCSPSPRDTVTMPERSTCWSPEVGQQFPLALHMEENPTGFGRKVPVSQMILGSAVGAGSGQWVTGEHTRSPQCPITHSSRDWALPGWQGWAHQQIPPGLGPLSPPFVGSGWAQGDQVHPKPQLPPLPAAPAMADVLEITLVRPCSPLPRPRDPIKTPREPGLRSAQHRKAP